MNVRTTEGAAALPFSSNIIGGASVGAADGRVVDVICPSDGKPFMQIARSGREDVDRAIKANIPAEVVHRKAFSEVADFSRRDRRSRHRFRRTAGYSGPNRKSM